MADKSRIEWTDATWNPVTGCTKVSPGCDHCYAERVTERFHGPGSFAKVMLHPDRLDQPLRWRKPRRVFVNSMSDLFHDDVPDEYIAKVFAVMAGAPQHTFQVLTKRHGRMRSLVGGDFADQVAEQVTETICRNEGRPDVKLYGKAADGGNLWGPRVWPLSNVWLGVSVENQQWADIRIPALLDTPAAVRFLSCEPLLGPVAIKTGMRCPVCQTSHKFNPNPCDPYTPARFRTPNTRTTGRIDWVIVGGESGKDARPMHPDWARSLRDQCRAAGVPFFFKQWGEWAVDPDGEGWENGHVAFVDPAGRHEPTPGPAVPTWEPMRRVGKRSAGRVLDGRTWDEYPAVMADV